MTVATRLCLHNVNPPVVSTHSIVSLLTHDHHHDHDNDADDDDGDNDNGNGIGDSNADDDDDDICLDLLHS